MDERIEKWLYDILMAIEEIESFLADRPKRYVDFCNDVRTIRAVERNVEIIGEAMNRILKSDENIPITNARKIVDTRNYFIHGYDLLKMDILWSIVVNHLPLLRDEVKKLLAE